MNQSLISHWGDINFTFWGKHSYAFLLAPSIVKRKSQNYNSEKWTCPLLCLNKKNWLIVRNCVVCLCKKPMQMQNACGWAQIIFQMINVNTEIGLQYWNWASDFILCLEERRAEYFLLLKKLKSRWNELNMVGYQKSVEALHCRL